MRTASPALTDRLSQYRLLILEMIARGLPYDECLDAIADCVAELGNGLRAWFVLADESRSRVERIQGKQVPPLLRDKLPGAPIDDSWFGTCGRTIHRGERTICSDVAGDRRWAARWRDVCVASDIQACCSTPVFVGGTRPVGSLLLARDAPGEFSVEQTGVADIAAYLVSVLIQRTRTNALALEARASIEERIASLHQLIGICLELSAIRQERDFVRAVLKSACRLSNAPFASVQLPAPWQRLAGAREINPRIALSPAFNAQLAKQLGATPGGAKSRFVGDIAKTSLPDALSGALRKEGVRAMQFTTVGAGQPRPVGMLCMYWSVARAPSATRAWALEALATLTASLATRFEPAGTA
ncbi:GAF domain-containing protein [Burkholderia sp. SRS-W-2-2016]|uniref:GAF domain-containing protein n=1 Tax=Burkholderia sp. SRS-W-2-2016 TaxID=1926878 RepID=UPI000AF80B42|nr:GAF domain-containing protein [Burkholderia sp. SRS-W-2-2016]